MKMGKPVSTRSKQVFTALADLKITANVSLEIPAEGAADMIHLVIDKGVPVITLDEHQDIDAAYNLLCFVLKEIDAVRKGKKH